MFKFKILMYALITVLSISVGALYGSPPIKEAFYAESKVKQNGIIDFDVLQNDFTKNDVVFVEIPYIDVIIITKSYEYDFTAKTFISFKKAKFNSLNMAKKINTKSKSNTAFKDLHRRTC
jgi:hypothetical protein